ncbi:MAG: class II aldolase/adducin family protein [Bacteroidota bacterium]|jgi:ribulose-5-phosphate 4-epimerase/fuculose-1-phosphate aldolase
MKLNINSEGIIKFNCDWLETPPISFPQFEEINLQRQILHNLDLIGEYSDGLGYGNLSIRRDETSFFITASQTGGIPHLGIEHYTLVTKWDIYKNYLKCEGPAKASSESLTHAAIYALSPEIGAVVHVHTFKGWLMLLNKIPTSNPNIKYGTPAMAYEIFRLYRESNLRQEKILVMAGHREGIISFGNDINDAASALLNKIDIFLNY